MTPIESGPREPVRRRAVRWCAVTACLLAGCYRPARPDCAVSCADGAPCPDGLTCGSTDQLCHAGAIECSAAELPGDAATGTGNGTGADSDAAPGIDANPGYCAPQSGLIGCYQFENTARNALTGLDITINDKVEFPPGKFGRAAAFDTTATASIAADPHLDLSTFTIETWVNPSKLPSNETSLVNRYQRYGMTFDAKGALICAYNIQASGGRVVVTAPVALTLGQWSHVACTVDSAQLSLYINGQRFVLATAAGPVATGGTEGISIGGGGIAHPTDLYVGQLDELRIFGRALTMHEICVDAGRADCG